MTSLSSTAVPSQTGAAAYVANDFALYGEMVSIIYCLCRLSRDFNVSSHFSQTQL